MLGCHFQTKGKGASGSFKWPVAKKEGARCEEGRQAKGESNQQSKFLLNLRQIIGIHFT
jgi:hypothetical protein